MTFPTADLSATLRVGDEVIVSLRTDNLGITMARFTEAEQALARH